MESLDPKEFDLPDIREAGNLTYGALCDLDKLTSVLSTGIRPRGGNKQSGSYYPDVVSLNALSPFGGYSFTDGITGGFLLMRHQAITMNEDVDLDMALNFSFILDQAWIDANIRLLLGVGPCFQSVDLRTEYAIGPLTNIRIPPDFSPYQTDTFAEEVHYTGGIISPQAIRGVTIDTMDQEETLRGNYFIEKAIHRLKGKNSMIKFPLGVYDRTGTLVDLRG
jgi:hypothetical protein